MPETIENHQNLIGCIKDVIYSFFTCGTVFHFWYFVCLIYGIIILYVLLHFFKLDRVIISIFCLYILRGFFIYKIGGEVNFLYSFWSHSLQALSFLSCGILLTQKNQFKKSKKLDTLFNRKSLFIFFLIYVSEVILLKKYLFIKASSSYILSMLFLILFITNYLIKCDRFSSLDNMVSKKMRSYSTLVYCVHPFFIFLLNKVALYSTLSSLIQYILVVLCSLLFSYIILQLSELKLFKLLKKAY